ncbi:unnamed protein product, partial [Mesorhabditis belari]|uniref:Uncharacterized protein n=1 Tax=Mesorhabditis belari TaxID=2138241 RepID=A0AAF3EWL8_9BILA
MSLSTRNQVLFLQIFYYLTNLVNTVPLKVSDGVPDLFCGKPPIHIIFKPSTDVASTNVETSIMELANSTQAEV